MDQGLKGLFLAWEVEFCGDNGKFFGFGSCGNRGLEMYCENLMRDTQVLIKIELLG